MGEAMVSQSELLASTSSVLQSDVREVFGKFTAPRINLCLWRRKIDADLAVLLDEVARAGPFCMDHRADSQSIDLREPMAQLPTIGEPLQRLWVQDLHLLVQLFAEATDTRRVRIRLATIPVTRCPVFHSDYVGARLLCTYSGPGTQWLESRDVQRSELARGRGSTPEQANRRIVRAGATIGRAKRFDVALCKGELWPGNSDNGLVHRSPVVRTGDPPRVTFTVDIDMDSQASLGSA